MNLVRRLMLVRDVYLPTNAVEARRALNDAIVALADYDLGENRITDEAPKKPTPDLSQFKLSAQKPRGSA